MTIGLRAAGAVCVVSAAAGTAIAQDATPAWTLRLPAAQEQQPFVQSAANGRCVAVVTATAVHVISMNGEVMWSWNYRQSSRFLKPRLPYAPEPLAIAFDLNGDYLAISTGAERGYLVTRDLEPRWVGHLRDFPVRWPEQAMAGPGRAGLIDFEKGAVDALLGVPPWGRWVSDSVSADGQWRVLSQSPWARADEWQVLVFYGPEGHAFHGRWEKFSQRARPRWSKPMGCLDARITPDGEFVIAIGNTRHPEYHLGRSLTEAECFKEGALTTYVFDRNGSLLFSRRESSPGTGLTADFAEAFRQKTGRSLPPIMDAIGYTESCESSRDGVTPVCLPGPDGLVITSRGNELRAMRRR